MSYLAEHHQAVCDPFVEGDSAAQLGLMMNLTDGFDFPWREGGVALMRRELYPIVNPWEYCGLAVAGETQVKNAEGMGHAADQAYQYAAVTFLGNGLVSVSCEPIRLDFDDAGDLIEPGLPMFPVHLAATALAAGRFALEWEYDTYGQRVWPKDFQVFEGASAEAVDYETPLTDPVTGLSAVPYPGRTPRYTFTTPSYDNGSEHVFAVRGRNVNDVAEKNTFTTALQRARAVAPADAVAPLRLLVRGQRTLRG